MAYRKKTRPEISRAWARLQAAGLRPTRQRLELSNLLFRYGDRHVSAELLHQEALDSDVSISLATVYNTLHQFTAAGLLRQVIVEPSRSYFDTNMGTHPHFYDETNGELIDIPDGTIAITGLPTPPRGTAVDRVDVVIRLRRT